MDYMFVNNRKQPNALGFYSLPTRIICHITDLYLKN